MSFNKEELLAKANEASKNTLMETLNIEIIDFADYNCRYKRNYHDLTIFHNRNAS